MSENKEQVKPLAPAAHRINIQDSDAFSVEFTACRQRKWIKICGCSAAIILIIVMVMLVLMFTVFHVKDPVLKLNSASVQGVNNLNSTTNVQQGSNVTIQADVSIKNPNVASFKFSNATTYIYYDGTMIGETKTPPGEARARRTLRMNVTTVLMVDKIRGVRRLDRDLVTGLLAISSCTKISGKVKITRVFKREVQLNCTMKVNIRSQSVQDIVCSRRVSL